MIDNQLNQVFAQRGVTLHQVADGAAALELLKGLIPTGASVMTGSSATLEEIGFTEYLQAGNHEWDSWRAKIAAADDSGAREELRRLASLADWFLSSAHAVARTGQVVWGSGSGNQIAAHAYTAKNVVWVVGKQKIVADLPAALDRLNTHVVPKHAAKWKMKPPLNLSKTLIFDREDNPRRQVHLVVVDQEISW